MSHLSCNDTSYLSTDWGGSWPVRKFLPCGYIGIQYWWIPGCDDCQHYFQQNTTLVQYNGIPAVPHYRFCGICHGYKWLDDDCGTSTLGNIYWTTNCFGINLLWYELPALSGSSWTRREDKGGGEDNSGERHTVCFLLLLSKHGATDRTRFDACIHVHELVHFIWYTLILYLYIWTLPVLFSHSNRCCFNPCPVS